MSLCKRKAYGKVINACTFNFIRFQLQVSMQWIITMDMSSRPVTVTTMVGVVITVPIMALLIKAHGGSTFAIIVTSMHRTRVRESIIPFIGIIFLKVIITYRQQKWKYARAPEKVTKNERSTKNNEKYFGLFVRTKIFWFN